MQAMPVQLCPFMYILIEVLVERQNIYFYSDLWVHGTELRSLQVFIEMTCSRGGSVLERLPFCERSGLEFRSRLTKLV